MAKCKHSIYDTDPHFFIDPITRKISTECKKVALIQGDHNSERFTFEVPRHVEGHDLSLCNRVQVHYINVDKRTKEQSADVYEPDDFQVFPEDDSVVVCSWLLSGNATKYAGTLSFVVRFACVSEGVVEYAWSSAVYSGIIVSDGINNSDIVVEEYSDILEQWRNELFSMDDGISEYSRNLGIKSFAGCKGFRIAKFEFKAATWFYVYLDGYTGGYKAGDWFSCCLLKTDGNEYIYDLKGTIYAIEENKLTIYKPGDGNFYKFAEKVNLIENPTHDTNTFWVPNRPTVGNIDIGVCATATGYSTRAVGGYSSAEGMDTQALGKYAHSEGVGTKAYFAAHAEGRFTNATGQCSHSEGYNTNATGDKAHAEGSNSTASGMSAHAEGNGTTASGERSHSEGENTQATAKAAHSEGNGTEATEEGAHAEGITTHAKGAASHAEGKNSTANGENSHAEGDNTSTGEDARGAHSEGINTSATGLGAHAEGYATQAKGKMSHAGGEGTVAESARQTVIGKYNEIDEKGKYAFIVGNGTSDTERSNALAVTWTGNLVVGGVEITPEQITKLLALVA